MPGISAVKIGIPLSKKSGINWSAYWTTHSYEERIDHFFGSSLIAHFPLNEASGLVAQGRGTLPTEDNHIPNSGFESTAFGSWGYQNATVSLTTTAGEFHSGAKALKVVRTATVGNIARKIIFTPGVKYRLKFWIRGDGTNGQTYHIRRSDFGAYLIAENTPTGVTGTDFVEITSAEFTAPAGYNFCWVYVQTANAADATFYIDDIELYPTEGITVSHIRGLYTNATLNQPGIKASEVSAYFAATGGVDFAQFVLNIAPTGTSGTVLIWVKPEAAALTDGGARYAVKIKTTAVSGDANYLTIYKSATNNKCAFQFKDDTIDRKSVV